MHIKQHSDIADELIEIRAVIDDLKDSIEIAVMDGIHESKEELYELIEKIAICHYKMKTHLITIREKLFLKNL